MLYLLVGYRLHYRLHELNMADLATATFYSLCSFLITWQLTWPAGPAAECVQNDIYWMVFGRGWSGNYAWGGLVWWEMFSGISHVSWPCDGQSILTCWAGDRLDRCRIFFNDISLVIFGRELSRDYTLNNVVWYNGMCTCVGTDGWRVPSIRPLETLHNALTLRQVDNFIKNVTEIHCKTPVSSPVYALHTTSSATVGGTLLTRHSGLSAADTYSGGECLLQMDMKVTSSLWQFFAS